MTSPILAAGLALGYAADLAFGDPRRFHPVAGFGSFALALERRLYADDVASGGRFAALAMAPPVALAAALDLETRRRPLARLVLVAACTWGALGGRSLAREGREMSRRLERADLPAARERLGHLCAREAGGLGEADLARATVESLAENAADAVVAPLVWGALAGPAGIVAHRCINTLDAMVGYRNPRYEHFGRVAARLDDAANRVPSRVTAALVVALAPVVGGRAADAWRAWRDDAPAHPSPNAGPVEAAAAGALGVRLGGANVYGGRREERGELGDGRPVVTADIVRTLRLTRAVGAAALVIAAAVSLSRRGG